MYPEIAARLGSFFSASSASSSSHDRTTLPWFHSLAMAGRSSLYTEASRSSNPSAYAWSSPYSMPLWIIFT